MYLGIVVGCRMYVLQPCSKTFNTVVDFVFPDETKDNQSKAGNNEAGCTHTHNLIPFTQKYKTGNKKYIITAVHLCSSCTQCVQ